MSPPWLRSNYADPAARVGSADLGILELRELLVEPGGVVDQEIIVHPAGVELPERDQPAVRAPAKAVMKAELFFVDPVERPVDHERRIGPRELLDLAREQVLHIDVAIADVGDLAAVRREMGEHQ